MDSQNYGSRPIDAIEQDDGCENRPIRADRFPLLQLVAGSAVAVLAGVALLYFVDPAGVDWLPKCPLHQLTGWHCPGCGITRAGHALLHGDVQGALAKNPLVVVAGPFLVGFCIWKRWREGRGWSTKVSARAILGLLAVLIVFAVLRNLPGYPFELLAPH